MTTDLYIQQNETETFKKGDEVVMVRCYEATLKTNKGRVYTCKTDSFKSKSGDEVVFLEGIGGFFAAKFLEKINMQTDRKSTRLNSSHVKISYAVFCLKKKRHNKRHC